MRKIPKAPAPVAKSFVDDGKVKLTTQEIEGKITSFTVTYKGKEKTFPVKEFNILAAWKEVEKFTADIK